MSKMKGTMLFNIMGQGFSESFLSSSVETTYNGMFAKLQNIIPFRCRISNTITDKNPGTAGALNNLLSVVGFRVSDELKVRDALVEFVDTPGGFNDVEGNLDGNLAAKIRWLAPNSTLIAATYLHGVPVNSTTQAFNPSTRQQKWNNLIKFAVSRYLAAVAIAGLGFPTIDNNPANAVGPITAVTYSAITGYYTIQTALPVPQGRFRVALRGFKSLRLLNGRRPAQATGANQFIVAKRGPSIAWDGWGTAVPLSGYNNGVIFNNYIVSVPNAAEPDLLCTRKLGRGFFLQRGRRTSVPA
jgi:hypothetical protein